MRKYRRQRKTLWTGGPSPKRPNYCGGNISNIDGEKMSDIFNKARKALANGENADSICSKLIGEQEGYGSYQCAGEMKIIATKKKIREYEFELDLDNAISTCKWKTDGGLSERKAFVSYPDKVAVISQTSDVADDWEIVWNNRAKGNVDIKIDDKSLNLGVCLDDNDLAFASYIKNPKATERYRLRQAVGESKTPKRFYLFSVARQIILTTILNTGREKVCNK